VAVFVGPLIVREPDLHLPVLMDGRSPKVAVVALQSVENVNPRTVASPVADSTEREMLERIARSRDQAAFRTLYGNYYQRLSRLLARMSVRREDIEEVINDTFWVVWTKAAEFRGASQLSTWIIGIAYRRALNALRRAKLRPVSDEPFDEDSISVGSSEEQETNEQWLSLGLERLPVEQRMALELTYTLGHSCEEVAAILDCPVNTVKTRLFRARETLKHVLPELAGMAGENS
jgi:RNA polymerase sigma-70 factor, ECF subfamily